MKIRASWYVTASRLTNSRIKLFMLFRFFGKQQACVDQSVKRGIEALLQKELVCEIDEKYYVYDVFLSLWLSQKF